MWQRRPVYGEFWRLWRRERLRVGSSSLRRRGVVNYLCSRSGGQRQRGDRSSSSFIIITRSPSLPPLVCRAPTNIDLPTCAAATVQPRPVVDLLPVQTSTTTTVGIPKNHDDCRREHLHDHLCRHVSWQHIPSSFRCSCHYVLLTSWAWVSRH